MTRSNGQIQSIRQLATAVGFSHKSVAKWVKNSAWTFGNGPWPASIVSKIPAWRKANLADDPNERPGTTRPPDDVTLSDAEQLRNLNIKDKSKVRLAFERASTEKVRRSILEKHYHSAVECRTRRVQQIQAVRDELLVIRDRVQLPSDLTSNQMIAVRAAVHQEIENVLTRMADEHRRISLQFDAAPT